MTNEDIKQQVTAWLDANWDAQALRPRDGDPDDIIAWNGRVLDAGWMVPRWPEAAGGRGFSDEQGWIVEHAFRAVGAPGAGADRTSIPANTLLAWGSGSARAALLRPFLTGEKVFCLLYSEPGAGSDLASIRTRAERNGDHYVVTGQKVWTSGARSADYGLLLARTDWDVPKHAGISFFLCPMHQPGVDVRPLHQITGERHFNEVFLDNAIVPADHLLGQGGDGWKILQTALAFERLMMGEGAAERRPDSTDNNEANLLAFARDAGRLGDPVIRQRIAQAIGWRRLNQLNNERAKAEMAAGGSAGSPVMSLSKLAISRILHNDAAVMAQILGATAMLDGESHALAEDVNYRGLHAYMNSIGGGTDQIQRNIIAERILGLPREMEADRNIPFRESAALRG